MSLPPLSQQILADDVRIENVEGRGKGVFAKRNLAPREQILFVARPLMAALSTAKLPSHCYYCYKEPYHITNSGHSEPAKTLKSCGGCKGARFCNQKCQKLAWKQYHKLECGLFAKLHPMRLPQLARATIRTLKQHEAGLVSDSEWDELLNLEGHHDKFRQAGGQSWEDLSLLATAIKCYAGTKHTEETVLRIVCKVKINSFGLVDRGSEEVGMALDPRPALMNHSCEPNAFVRFDIPPTAVDANPLPPYGGISVHALRAISKDEEITVCYVEATKPRIYRQEDLKIRYFFDCTCTKCARGLNPLVDFYHLREEVKVHPQRQLLLQHATSRAGLQAEQYLIGLESKGEPETQAEVDDIRAAMKSLADTEFWPLFRYPWPQLRLAIIVGLRASGKMVEPTLHSAIVARVAYPVLYPVGGPAYPSTLQQTWILITALQNCLLSMHTAGKKDMQEGDIRFDWQMVELTACVILAEAHTLINTGVKTKGRVEKDIDASYEQMKMATAAYATYRSQPKAAAKAAFEWLDGKIIELLKAEGVAQDVIDLSFSRRGQLPKQLT